jgi:hypothetical protein
MTLSDIPAALFSSFGLMGAAISRKETRFAGYMLIFSAVFIRLSVPIAKILLLLYLYHPMVACYGIAGTLCFMEPEANKAEPSESNETCFWWQYEKKGYTFGEIIPRLLYQSPARPVACRYFPVFPVMSFPG